MSNPNVIAFHYTLTGPTGATLDSSVGQEPMSFIEGSGQIIPGLEKKIKGLKDKQKIAIAAAEAYGQRDDRLVLKVPRDKLPAGDIALGTQFQISGDNSGMPFMVTEVTIEHAILDGNHPLAGMDLTFDVEVISVREATEQELSHGHTHGAQGHDH